MGRKVPKPLFELLRDRERASLGAHEPPPQTRAKIKIDLDALTRPTKSQLRESQRERDAREVSPENPIRVMPAHPHNLPSGDVLARMARGATVLPTGTGTNGHPKSSTSDQDPAQPRRTGNGALARLKSIGASARPQLNTAHSSKSRQHVVTLPMTAVYVGLPMLVLGMVGAYSIGHVVGSSDAEKRLAPYAAANTTKEQALARTSADPTVDQHSFAQSTRNQEPATIEPAANENDSVRIADGEGTLTLLPHIPTTAPHMTAKSDPDQIEWHTQTPSNNEPESSKPVPAVTQPVLPDVLRDTRVVGLNYLRVVSSLAREDAIAAAEYLAANGVPAFATVDTEQGGGNNGSLWCVRAARGFEGAPRWNDSKEERRQLQVSVAKIGQDWQQNHRGVSDFSQTYFEKKLK